MAAKFRRYYYLVLGRLWLILLIVAVSVGGTWAWLQRQPSVYSSTATVFVEQAEPRIVKMDKVENDKPESAEFVLTAVQMLGTKELMLRVAKSLSASKGFDPGSRRPDGSPLALEEIANIIGDQRQGQVAPPNAVD